jgi:hypothetical protein
MSNLVHPTLKLPGSNDEFMTLYKNGRTLLSSPAFFVNSFQIGFSRLSASSIARINGRRSSNQGSLILSTVRKKGEIIHIGGEYPSMPHNILC